MSKYKKTPNKLKNGLIEKQLINKFISNITILCFSFRFLIFCFSITAPTAFIVFFYFLFLYLNFLLLLHVIRFTFPISSIYFFLRKLPNRQKGVVYKSFIVCLIIFEGILSTKVVHRSYPDLYYQQNLI